MSRAGGPALLLAALIAWGAPVGAAEPLPTAVAAVVDFQALISQSAAGRSIHEQIEAQRRLDLEQLAREEERLLELERALSRERPSLSAQAFAERRRLFEAQVHETQRASQERSRKLERARAEALGQVREVALDIMSELAESRGFNIVLPASALLLFAPAIDLTGEVMAKLDAALPSLPVQLAPD